MNTKRRYILVLVAALAIGITAQAASPAGTWSVNANGYTGSLVINVDPAGNVTGTFFGNPIKGFWSVSAARLMFYRAINGTTLSTPPEAIQIYTGYMYPGSAANPNGSQRLAGSFEAFAGTGATATKNVLGWYAAK